MTREQMIDEAVRRALREKRELDLWNFWLGMSTHSVVPSRFVARVSAHYWELYYKHHFPNEAML